MVAAGGLQGWLEIRGLRCAGRHGAYVGEQDESRTFLVDLAVRAEVGRAARSDALADALDFAALAATAREVVGGPSRALLETLAVDVARAVFGRFPTAAEARVRVAKPEPPGLDADQESVEVTVARAALAD